jgi:hypothetical protein
MKVMSAIVQARLDPETKQMLDDLAARLDKKPSEIVRDGIRLLSANTPRAGKRRFIGLGQFRSGIGDLSTNKKHMKDFGK